MPWSSNGLESAMFRLIVAQGCVFLAFLAFLSCRCRVAKLVEIGRRGFGRGMVGWIRRRGQGRWVKSPRSLTWKIREELAGADQAVEIV